MIADVTFEKTIYNGPPERFEAGTGNIADAVGLGAAIDYVEAIGMDVIARYEHELLVYATERLLTVPGLKLIGTARDKASVLSFVLDECRTQDVGVALDREGIAVRAGHHCAQPILRRFGLESTVRPSLAFYNTREDIDALETALKRIQSGRGYRGSTSRNRAARRLTARCAAPRSATTISFGSRPSPWKVSATSCWSAIILSVSGPTPKPWRAMASASTSAGVPIEGASSAATAAVRLAALDGCRPSPPGPRLLPRRSTASPSPCAVPSSFSADRCTSTCMMAPGAGEAIAIFHKEPLLSDPRERGKSSRFDDDSMMSRALRDGTFGRIRTIASLLLLKNDSPMLFRAPAG